jgi:hypothetical protein
VEAETRTRGVMRKLTNFGKETLKSAPCAIAGMVVGSLAASQVAGTPEFHRIILSYDGKTLSIDGVEVIGAR